MSSVRCSKCSEIIRPVVAVDIDGTLGDYHTHFLEFAANWLAEDPLWHLLQASKSMYDGVDPFSEYCMALFGIDLPTYRQIKLAYRQGGMKRTMPMINGARTLCDNIVAADTELWLTTTRPYLSLDNIVPDTVFWLNNNEIPFDGMLFDEDKYTQLAERVDPERVVAVLDDLEEMCEAADGLFPDKAVLMQNKFNAGVNYHPQISMREAWGFINNRIKNWRRMHG